MPDITITPGTFNPPGTLAVVHGALDFPRTPVQQVKRPALQYNSRWVEPEAVDPPLAVNVYQSSRDYVTGQVTVRSSAYVSGASSFEVTGVRYVPDDTYAVTAQNAFSQEYTASATADFAAAAAGSGAISIGTIVVEQGSSNINWISSSSGVIVTLYYSVATSGVSGAFDVYKSDSSGALLESSGTIKLRIPLAVEDIPAEGVTRTVNELVSFAVYVRSGGVEIDRIFVTVPIVGTIQIEAQVPMEGEDLDIPVPGTPLPITHATGYNFTDTLYGTLATPSVSPPGVPFSDYYRRSIINQGNLAIP